MGMVSESVDALATVQQLEKENRILRKKLERSQQACLELEQTNQKKESLLRQVILELENSQREVEEKRQLEQTLIELRQTQAQLIHAEKMSSLGQLVAGVAHEINNPVNFIYGNLSHVQDYAQNLLSFIQLYQQHYPEPIAAIQAEAEKIDLEFLQYDLPKVLDSIQIGTERIRQIVLSLRNFSRMDEAEFKPVDIHEGIDSTLLILQHRLKACIDHPDIEVIRDYGRLPLVECYAGQLNQVFMNILSNAIDAIEEKFQDCVFQVAINAAPEDIQHMYTACQQTIGQIRIQTAIVDSAWVQITIADNGMGMSEQVKQKIFNPFFTTKPLGKGTGMGMPISHQIITAKHGGQLECHSIPRQGTEFIISIPVQQ